MSAISRTVFSGAALVAALVSGLTAIGAGVQREARERQAYVSALDANGAVVQDLKPEDVLVREDGVRREVLRVSKATAPMQIALLVDNSQAASSSIQHLRTGLGTFIRDMAGKNEIALITIGDRSTIAVEYTKDAAALNRAADRLFGQPGAGAYFMDAVVDVARGFSRREAQRPVIVAVLVDGVEFSNQNYNYVLSMLRESGAALHTLMYVTAASSAADNEEIRNRNLVIDRGTRTTGGRRDDLLTAMAFPQKLKELAAELSNQYLVVYGRPESLIPPEQIEIESNRPGITVRGTPVRQKGT